MFSLFVVLKLNVLIRVLFVMALVKDGFMLLAKILRMNAIKALAGNLKNEWFCERVDCAPTPNLQSLERKFDQLLATLNDMVKGHGEFTKSLQFFSDSFDEMKKELEEMKKLKDDLNVVLTSNSGLCAHTEVTA